MTRRRDPQTIAGAVAAVVGALTKEHCADMLNVKPRQIWRYADDTEDGTPITVENALRLDAAYVNEGHGDAPILKVYRQLLDRRTEGAQRQVGELFIELLDVDDVRGQLAAAIHNAVASSSPGGRNFTANEALEGIGLAERMIDQLQDVIQALRVEGGINSQGGGGP